MRAAAALATLLVASVATAAADPLVQEDSGAVVNWRRGVVSATAGAAPDHRTPSADVARPGAERRARANARTRLGEALRKLPLGGGRKLDDAAISRALDRAQSTDVEYQSNGGVVLTLEVVFGSWDASPSDTTPAKADDHPLALSLGEGHLAAAPVVMAGGRELTPAGVRYSNGSPPAGSPRPLKARADKQGRLVVDAGAAGELAGRPLVIYLQKVLR